VSATGRPGGRPGVSKRSTRRLVSPRMRRRTILSLGTVLAGAGLAAGTAWWRTIQPAALPALPAAAPGDERVVRRRSAARGRDVDFYTAVPAGHGDGRGLPVCLVLHGASRTAADFPALGLGRYLSDATARGASPFVLAGATGGRLSWRPSGADDPQRMVHEEVPAWCAERGFDASRLTVWGWSMGGYGALLLAETFPGLVRRVAAFSPATTPGDTVFASAARLRGTPVGLWCGRDDALCDNVRALQQALPEPPAAGGYTLGGHNFGYWATIIPPAFDFLATDLSPSGPPAR
jgi:S-formylglutathione hydrolase FrmB